MCHVPRDFWYFEARGDTGDRRFPTPGWLFISISNIMHSPYVTMRLFCLGTVCWGSCWSIQTREDHRCGREFVLLAKPKKRCCETDRAMSHLPIGQAAKIEHWRVYASTRARPPLARCEHEFRVWTFVGYQKAWFYICDCGLFFKNGPLTMQHDLWCFQNCLDLLWRSS